MKKYEILLIISGSILGFTYWNLWGCTSDCAIKSQWWATILWGGLLGWVIAGFIKDSKKEKENNNSHQDSKNNLT